MKNTRKILAALMAVMMVFSCITLSVAAAGKTFSDVGSDEAYSTAVKNLCELGVINGYEDGTFKPEQSVTRAEFTAMLMRTLGLGNVGSTSAADLPFSDVDDNNSDISWAIPNINTAYGKGIINGYEDGTFRPSAEVAYEEAVKMIVCTLGYGSNVDVSITPWYANYIGIAAQIGITKKAQSIGQCETPASRACIAQLLYDSLEIKLIENDKKTDKTILGDYLGYTKLSGVIYSNDITSLDSRDVNLRENEIQILARDKDSNVEKVNTYITDDYTLKNYLGYPVEFYYTSNDGVTRNLMFCVLKGDEPVVVNAANIEQSLSTETQIKYYENLDDDKDKTLNLDAENIVIYNGKLYGENSYSSSFTLDMIPFVGSIKFIDSDKNGKYDVLDIVDYDVYYVSTKSSSTYEVVDNLLPHGELKTLVLDINKDRNLSIVDTKGSKVDFNSISTGNVVCVATSNGPEPIRKAVVVTDKVSGTISSINRDKVTINETEYRYSKLAPWITGTKDAPQLDDNGTFALDINGDIVAFTTTESNTSYKYGYIVGYSESKDFDKNITIRLLNTSGTTEYIGVYKNTKIDGSTYSNSREVIEKLKETAKTQHYTEDEGIAIQQLVKYSTKTNDGSTVFDRIYTAKDQITSGQEVVNDKLTVLDSEYNKNMKYNSSAKTLGNDKITVTTSGITVFLVPKDDRSDYDSFKKSALSYFNDKEDEEGETIDEIDVYDISKANAPKVVVIYSKKSEISDKDIATSSSVWLLDSINEEYNSKEDATMYRASAYKIGASVPTSASNSWISTASDSSYKDMTTGDIFRTGTDKDGYAKILAGGSDKEKSMIYDADGYNEFRILEDSRESSKAEKNRYFSGIIGSVVGMDNATITVVPENLNRDSDGYDHSKVKPYSISAFKDAKVVIYDKVGSEITLLDGDYESALAGLVPFEDGGVEPSKVLIYQREGSIKLLCILPSDND